MHCKLIEEAQRIRRLIDNLQDVWVLCHERPDGDALGSAAALGLQLEAWGKRCALLCSTEPPDIYAFLDRLPQREPPPWRPQAMVVLDSASPQLLGKHRALLEAFGGPVVNIDHHPDNPAFGQMNVVIPQASSTGEVLYELMEQWGARPEGLVAQALLVALVAETGCFCLPNTTARCLEVAAALVRQGANPWEIQRRLHRGRSLAVYRLWGEVLLRLRQEGCFAWSFLSRRMLARHGLRLEEVQADELANLLCLGPWSLCVLFKELEGEIRVSLRSSGGQLARKLALRLGGGGHPEAAACTIQGGLLRALRELRRELAALRAEADPCHPAALQ